MSSTIPDVPIRLTKSARVLLVEDDPLMRRMLSRLLHWWDLEVVEAFDGLAALDHFRAYAGRFDAVLLDIMLPRLNGVEVARAILEDRPGLPIIACSAAFDPAMLDKLDALGVSERLEKPFNAAALRSALSRVLGTRLRCD
jgi:CheY-like chemotaxis protein